MPQRPAPRPESEPEPAWEAPPRPEPAAAAPLHEPAPEPKGRRSSQVQSADDILAAARERIQRRAAQLTQPAFTANGVDSLEDLQALPTQDGVSDAMRELLATSAPEPAANGHIAEATPRRPPEPMRPRLVPTPARPEPQPPQPAMPPAPAPFGALPGARPSPGPPQPMAPPPPMQARGGAPRPPSAPPPAGLQVPAQPAPPVTMDPRRVRRAATPLSPHPAQPASRKSAGQADRGPITEAIPRRMRIGATSHAEVRIARERIDSVVQSLAGRGGADPNEPVMTRAITVRLRAPSGELFVEPQSPETQWVEQVPGTVDAEPLVWAWHVTPRSSGKEDLVLLVSMRSLGPNGASEDTGLPDRVVQIRVRGRGFRRLLRGILWVGLLGIAFLLGRVGGELGPMLVKTVRQLVGL